MKIKPKDYAVLKSAIEAVVLARPGVEIEYKELGRSPKRLRWDYLWKSGLKIGDGAGAPGDVNIYAYAHDEHIDTALRQIMKELGQDWAAQK